MCSWGFLVCCSSKTNQHPALRLFLIIFPTVAWSPRQAVRRVEPQGGNWSCEEMKRRNVVYCISCALGYSSFFVFDKACLLGKSRRCSQHLFPQGKGNYAHLFQTQLFIVLYSRRLMCSEWKPSWSISFCHRIDSLSVKQKQRQARPLLIGPIFRH